MTDSKYDSGQEFIFDTNPVIKGYPELRWTGKRPYRSTQYYPAQLRESYGDPADGPDGKPWMNKIYWGDNLQGTSLVERHVCRKRERWLEIAFFYQLELESLVWKGTGIYIR